jgi:hypothetical protein
MIIGLERQSIFKAAKNDEVLKSENPREKEIAEKELKSLNGN